MARNDIGTLNVRVQADTAQFVNGMARAQATMDRTTQAAGKSRTALAALGGALKMPGLGRGAAFGGAASGIASALGVGALGGGVAGVAATAGFIAVDALIAKYREMNQLAAERAEKEKEAAAAMMESARAAQQVAANIRAYNSGTVSMQERLDAFNTQNAEQLRTLDERHRTIIEQLRREGLPASERERLLRQAEGVNNLRQQQIDIANSERARIRGDVGQPAETNRRGLLDRARSGIGEAFSEFNFGRFLSESARNEQVRIEADRAQAEATKELADAIARGLEEWQRTNQRASDQIATVASRISSQITQLTYRRD